MTTRSPLIRSRVLPTLLISLLLGGSWLTSWAEEAKRAFDIPAGKAEATLKAFSNQAATQFFYSADKVSGVHTNAIKGEMVPSEALEAMLARTELVAVRDEKTGALTINRATAPNAPRVALERSSDRPDQGKIEDGKVVMDTYTVTGSRIRSLVGEQAMHPMLAIDQRQIERTGASTVGDLFRYIPQISYSSNGVSPKDGPMFLEDPHRVTAQLRAFDSTATLILIDGRRVPKTGQAGSNVNYDLGGLPLAAVERVEVLLDGASAIYGADAVAGVINIITKKNFQGTELRLSYDNPIRYDAPIVTTALTHGLARGAWRGRVSVAYERNQPPELTEIPFLGTFDQRGWGGTDQRSTSYRFGPGFVSTTNGANLPGLSSSTAAIPAGATGGALTVADYANAGPLGEPLDWPKILHTPPTITRSGSASLEYRQRPWLVLFADAAASQSSFTGSIQPVATPSAGLVVPAGYPGNPFGIPLKVSKVYFDQFTLSSINRSSTSVTLGVRGDLPAAWRYQASVGVNRAVTDQILSNTVLSQTLANTLLGGSNPPAVIYGTASGNAPGSLEALIEPYSVPSTREIAVNWIYDAQADGPTFALPAGDARLAVTAQGREEYGDYPVLKGGSASSLSVRLKSSYRRNIAVAAETRVPVVSPAMHWRGINRVELSAALRHDGYSDFSSATSPSAAVLVQPLPGLLFRGTWGKGYWVPLLSQLYRPATTTNSTVSVTDPLRGNTLVPKPWGRTTVGNPGLRGQKSENLTVSAILDVPFVKGLSLTGTWYQTDYTDRVQSLAQIYSFSQILALFPERVTRGPNLPNDQPGWAGPVTSIHLTSINIGLAKATGWDAGLKYDRATPWGEVQMRFDIAKLTRNEARATPSSDPSPNIGAWSTPMRMNGSVFWTRGAAEVGTLFTYQGEYRLFAGGVMFPSAIRWDSQVSYDFDRAGWPRRNARSWVRTLLAGSRVSLTVFNLFDRDPPLVNDFSISPVYGAIEERMLHYQLQWVKKF